MPGAKLFATSGCTACHTYLGTGSSNLGAPDLTAIGTRNLGIQFQIRHLQCPSCVNPGSPMPKFASLGLTRLHQLAIFLESLQGQAVALDAPSGSHNPRKFEPCTSSSG